MWWKQRQQIKIYIYKQRINEQESDNTLLAKRANKINTMERREKKQQHQQRKKPRKKEKEREKEEEKKSPVLL